MNRSLKSPCSAQYFSQLVSIRMCSLPPVDIWDSTYTRHWLLCKQTSWTLLETHQFLRLFWHLFSLWRMGSLFFFFMNISPFHSALCKYFIPTATAQGRQIIWIQNPTNSNSQLSVLLTICHYQTHVIIRFAVVNLCWSHVLFQSFKQPTCVFRSFTSCVVTLHQRIWNYYMDWIISSGPTVYARFALHKIEDQCPCALCIHLFPHLFPSAKPFINQWTPGFTQTKRLAFLWSSKRPLFHSYPHNPKLPIYRRERGI